jgi:hypothetical protein
MTRKQIEFILPLRDFEKYVKPQTQYYAVSWEVLTI